MKVISIEVTLDNCNIGGEEFEFTRVKVTTQLTGEEYPQLIERFIFNSEEEAKEYLKNICTHEALTDTGENLLFCPMCDNSWTESEWEEGLPSYPDFSGVGTSEDGQPEYGYSKETQN